MRSQRRQKGWEKIDAFMSNTAYVIAMGCKEAPGTWGSFHLLAELEREIIGHGTIFWRFSGSFKARQFEGS